MTVKLPKNYRPKESETFMNPKMREYFRQKLLRWKDELQRESGETLQHLQEVSLHEPDIAEHCHRIVRLRDGLVETDVENTNVIKASDPTHRYNIK